MEVMEGLSMSQGFCFKLTMFQVPLKDKECLGIQMELPMKRRLCHSKSMVSLVWFRDGASDADEDGIGLGEGLTVMGQQINSPQGPDGM